MGCYFLILSIFIFRFHQIRWITMFLNLWPWRWLVIQLVGKILFSNSIYLHHWIFIYIYIALSHILLIWLLGQVRAMSFHRLAHLIRLDLSTCQISEIESGAFDGLLAIQRIYLHGNHIVTISAGDLPPSLHGISVYDNR